MPIGRRPMIRGGYMKDLIRMARARAHETEDARAWRQLKQASPSSSSWWCC